MSTAVSVRHRLLKTFVGLAQLAQKEATWEDLCDNCQTQSRAFYDALGYSVENPYSPEDEDREEGELEEGELEEGELETEEEDGEIESGQDEPRLLYLTPSMMEMFRASEQWRLEQRREKELAQALAESAETLEAPAANPVSSLGNQTELDAAVACLDQDFDRFVEEYNPVFWPVLSMTF
ncbi:hypothetical protein HDU91_006990 [Kappamyces sp. JEL0680]|nr:hypothetical protein HDU91_006990 [Kappamyces sp. JEL0680]